MAALQRHSLPDDLIKAVVDACLAAAGLHAKPDTANGARNGKHQHGSEKAAGAKADKEDTGKASNLQGAQARMTMMLRWMRQMMMVRVAPTMNLIDHRKGTGNSD